LALKYAFHKTNENFKFGYRKPVFIKNILSTGIQTVTS
jgi:hypothetical protein